MICHTPCIASPLSNSLPVYLQYHLSNPACLHDSGAARILHSQQTRISNIANQAAQAADLVTQITASHNIMNEKIAQQGGPYGRA